ncbi:MAG: rhomboid family intramembrane serine protease [Armatimonadota bacterium]|nr:rhomboid family intramembrane serine protease [Armatimonadota bacterium]MDR7439556.1 rhomboid family intramembrane serine protease [Armatimonadota bacterium]MDR7443786.1 rhomboid family intramembrane serine protease [Armatimonadota bacterium]MDR7569044.1 rhomboid family intramembrane serine protease [Armatimonadota bacterium]MDR7613933.1 rhomboid family intramembrane serine protease [Armatimonadota bacterium]
MIPLRDSVPGRRTPVMMLTLLGTNLLVFLYTVGLGSPEEIQALFETYGLVPAKLLGPDPPYYTLFTSMFLHGGWLHLVGNMLYLWIFGNNVEDATGHVGFLVFYVLCGLAAAFAQILIQPASRVPMVGASGAIAGVLGGYLVLYPRARILALVPLGFFLQLMEVPALLFLPMWFLLQLVYGIASLGVRSEFGGGVAFWAHIGGFVAGLVCIRVFARRPRRSG